MGTGQCVCAFEFEKVFRNAEAIRVDLLTAHIKFCRFWAKYLDGVLRGLTVRQSLGAYIRTSPSSSHQRCLHDAQRTTVNLEFLRPPREWVGLRPRAPATLLRETVRPRPWTRVLFGSTNSRGNVGGFNGAWLDRHGIRPSDLGLGGPPLLGLGVRPPRSVSLLYPL